ncbi:MAG: hypothetical protein QM778_20365 [Myxococcales bacterium]
MDIILAPDVYVNASVAPGTFPDRVVQRVLGKHRGESVATEWVLGRIEYILGTLPEFKRDSIAQQVKLIRSLVKVIPGNSDFPADAWEKALVSAAKASKATRVVTDHPDLLAKESSDGIEFVSSEAWLFEVTQPPPVPMK